MNFAEADSRYSGLKQQFDAGTLSAEAFDQALKELMVQDAQGVWWGKSRDTGAWNYYDATANAWVVGQPPISQPPVAPPPVPPASQTQPYVPPQPQPQPYVPSQPYASQPQPAGSGLSIVFYIISFLIPLVGIILFFIYKDKPFESDRKMAKTSLILGLVSIVLSCLCSVLYMALAGAGGYGY